MLFIPNKSTLFPQEAILFDASENIQKSLGTNYEEVGYVVFLSYTLF